MPLLLGGAKMPSLEQLPESPNPLFAPRAVEIPRGGVQPAIDRMMRGLGFAEEEKVSGGVPGWLVPLAAVIILAAGGFGLWQSGMLDRFLNPPDKPIEVAVAEADDGAEMSEAERDEANELEAARQQKIRDEEAAERQRQADMMAERQREKDAADEAAQTRREAIVLAARYPIGSTFRDRLSGGGEGPQMVVVPSGSFRMGSNDGASDEKPVHSVTISKPFAVGKFEVTWAEWGACVADGGCNSSGPESAGGDNGWGKGNRPVIEVDWNDAKAYVRWLSRKTGEDYRLLSEAEWEYAARAGSTGKYSWGNNDPSCSKGATNSANYLACSSNRTESVGFSSANAFGLHDLHGNVWEWTEDCWNGSYSGAPSNGSARLSGDCDRRVLRGGSWVSNPRFLRSASRYGYLTTIRLDSVGFRIARDLSD